jgi:hypothetical protein
VCVETRRFLREGGEEEVVDAGDGAGVVGVERERERTVEDVREGLEGC